MLDCFQQLGISLPHDLIKARGTHPSVLHLFKRTACVDALMLPSIPDDKHSILRTDLVQERSHLSGAGKARLIEHVEMSAGRIGSSLLFRTPSKKAL